MTRVDGACVAKYVEAILGIGQVYIEQARAQAGILMPPLDNIDSELYKELNQEELEELTKSQGRDSNAKLKLALKPVSSRVLSAPSTSLYLRFSLTRRRCFGPISPQKSGALC